MVGARGCIGKSVVGFYDDLVRIPLLMRLPGVIKPGTVVRQPVSQMDVMPTILDCAGQPVPEKLHGCSLRPLIEGRDAMWRDHAFCRRADRCKYGFGPKPRVVALYDLQADPEENKNLADMPRHAGLARQTHRRLLDVMKADGYPFAAKLPDDPLAQSSRVTP